ncbi:hypothetical protein ANN_21234 [Periplaneta americana]|uniref:DDE-1 domain-containing protein n=1 Tax=Periplaneta americana TaxID=6978 RepID=A0ABQ8SES0_PERAM|nr:hypothetical protein ANN_21234 [Periplaneta americana]
MPKENLPKGLVIRCQEKGWMTTELMVDWLATVWNRRPGHLTPEVKKKITALKTDLVVIPGGMTSKLQVLDVVVNKPFKDHLRKQYSDWLLEGGHAFTPSGKIKKPSVSLMCLKKCCVSNALDGSEDDVLWAESDEQNDSDETNTGTGSSEVSSDIEKTPPYLIKRPNVDPKVISFYGYLATFWDLFQEKLNFTQIVIIKEPEMPYSSIRQVMQQFSTRLWITMGVSILIISTLVSTTKFISSGLNVFGISDSTTQVICIFIRGLMYKNKSLSTLKYYRHPSFLIVMANRRDMRQRVIALVEAGYGARSAGRLVGVPGNTAASSLQTSFHASENENPSFTTIQNNR